MTTIYRTHLIVPSHLVHAMAEVIEDTLNVLAVLIGAPAEGDTRDTAHTTTLEILSDSPPSAVALPLILSSFGLPSNTSISTDIVENKNWVLSALRSLHPVHSGRFRVVGSHIDATPADWGIKLLIDAGMAFGTGHHETTLGCLHMIEHVTKVYKPQRALDIGTGTGILALALKKHLPATHILASDIDPIAVQVAHANMRLNQKYIRCITAANANNTVLRQTAPYDLIIANILAKPLINMAASTVPLLKRNGGIILAGLLADQQRRVMHAYRQQGCVLKHVIAHNAWRILYLQKQYD